MENDEPLINGTLWELLVNDIYESIIKNPYQIFYKVSIDQIKKQEFKDPTFTALGSDCENLDLFNAMILLGKIKFIKSWIINEGHHFILLKMDNYGNSPIIYAICRYIMKEEPDIFNFITEYILNDGEKYIDILSEPSFDYVSALDLILCLVGLSKEEELKGKNFWIRHILESFSKKNNSEKIEYQKYFLDFLIKNRSKIVKISPEIEIRLSLENIDKIHKQLKEQLSLLEKPLPEKPFPEKRKKTKHYHHHDSKPTSFQSPKTKETKQSLIYSDSTDDEDSKDVKDNEALYHVNYDCNFLKTHTTKSDAKHKKPLFVPFDGVNDKNDKAEKVSKKSKQLPLPEKPFPEKRKKTKHHHHHDNDLASVYSSETTKTEQLPTSIDSTNYENGEDKKTLKESKKPVLPEKRKKTKHHHHHDNDPTSFQSPKIKETKQSLIYSNSIDNEGGKDNKKHKRSSIKEKNEEERPILLQKLTLNKQEINVILEHPINEIRSEINKLKKTKKRNTIILDKLFSLIEEKEKQILQNNTGRDKFMIRKYLIMKSLEILFNEDSVNLIGSELTEMRMSFMDIQLNLLKDIVRELTTSKKISFII